MKKITFFPVNWIFLFKHSWILKIQPVTLEWLDQQFPDFFERYPNLNVVNTRQTTQASNNLWKRERKDCIGDFGSSLADVKFFFDVSIPLFSQAPTRYRQKDKQW